MWSIEGWILPKNGILYIINVDCVDHNKLWKILKEMGIPDHLTCLLRNLYAGQEATVRTGHGRTDLVPNRKRSTSRLLGKTLESPLDCKQIQPVHSKGDQFWDFFGRTDYKAETLILWPPDAKSWLIGKDSDAGRDCGQEEKGTTEDEMAGWHHQPDGHEFGWIPGAGDGQGGLACCDSWGCRVRHDWVTEMNWMLTSDWNAIIPDICMVKSFPLSGLCSKVILQWHLDSLPIWIYKPSHFPWHRFFLPALFFYVAFMDLPCTLFIYLFYCIYSLLSVLFQDAEPLRGQQLLPLLFTYIYILSIWNNALHIIGSQ